jgi:hypothetical protein
MSEAGQAAAASASNPAAPAGLRPGAQLDARFPVAFAETVPAAMRVLTAFFTALGRRDLDGLAATLHFPFATYEGIEPVVVESAEQLRAAPPQSLDVRPGSENIQMGAFDLLDELALHVYNPVGAACSLSYSRHAADGRLIARSDGIYAVTNNDGRWGIELISTIITPAAAIGVQHNDAAEAAVRRGRDWMLGYSRRDQSLLNSTHQLGRRANITLANPRANAGNARGGDPMAEYRVQGVKSRLRISETTPESIAAMDANFPQFAGWAGGAVGQWAYTINLPQARVLHATVDKAHTFGGYIRYTADHRPTSETHSLGIMTYKNNRWGSAGGIGVMMYHDYSNDRPSA